MKRYDLITNFRCGASIEEMELADEGEWVRYEDIADCALCSIEDGLVREWVMKARAVAKSKGLLPTW